MVVSDLQSFVAHPDTLIEDIALTITSELFRRSAEESQKVHQTLGGLVDGLGERLARCKDQRGAVGVFTHHVYSSLGFSGETEQYYDPRNSDLLSVLDRRKGIPISMAVVLMALGRRVGLNVEGVAFPGHFLARIGGPEGIFVDPFTRGMMMDQPSLERLLRKQLGPSAVLQSQHFEIATHSAIAQRMLGNLYAIYNARREHSFALIVADRLFSLNNRVEHQRDRGVHAMSMGAALGGREDLEAYLRERPSADDRGKIEALLSSSRAKATQSN